MRMLCCMCGKTRHDMIGNGNIREIIGVASIVKKVVETRLRWFGLVGRRPVDFVVRRLDQMEDSQITRGKGRPWKTLK